MLYRKLARLIKGNFGLASGDFKLLPRISFFDDFAVGNASDVDA
jgi:hypothetical protein